MKINRLLLLGVLMAAGQCMAQDTLSTDSIMVMGTVVSLQTDKPEPFCKIQFVQGGMVRASALSDIEGVFILENIPAGVYSIKVGLNGLTVFQDNIKLDTDTELKLKINKDTTRIICLPPVNVNVARSRNTLEQMGLLITSPSDPRIWNLRRDPTSLSMPASQGIGFRHSAN